MEGMWSPQAGSLFHVLGSPRSDDLIRIAAEVFGFGNGGEDGVVGALRVGGDAAERLLGIDGSVGNGRGGSSSGIERGVDNPSIAPTQFLDKPMKCLSGLACPLPQADFVWIWTASQQKCHRERYGDKCAAPVRCLECRKKHKERHHNIRRI